MNNKTLISTLLMLLSGCATSNTSSDLTAGTGHGASSAIQSSVSKKASVVPVLSQYSRASANSSKKEYLPLTTQPGLYVLSEEKTNDPENLNPEPDTEVFSPAVPLKQYSNHKNKNPASDTPVSSASNSSRHKGSGENDKILPLSNDYVERGIVSEHDLDFHGEKTSNGETYNMHGMTAAHKRLPISSYVKATNLNNKRSAVLRINDRGSFYVNQVIDLSKQTVKKPEIHQPGTEMVQVETIPTHHKERVYLQLGVFSNPENAQQLQRKVVENKMPEPMVKEIRMAGKLTYRVQLGPLFSAAKVNEFNAKLAKIGITEIWYVSENKL